MSNWQYQGGGSLILPNGTAGAYVNATANAWNQLSASVPAKLSAIHIAAWAASGTYMCHLGAGASGSQVAISDNILQGSGAMIYVRVPVSIPAGTNLWLFCDTGSNYFSTKFETAGGAGLNRYKSFNALNSAYVTSVSATWVQVNASTPVAATALMLLRNGASAGSTNYEIGVGASGSQVTIATAQMAYSGYQSENTLIETPLPKGSNLWVRQTGASAKIQILALN